jgi:hypothetical protein
MVLSSGGCFSPKQVRHHSEISVVLVGAEVQVNHRGRVVTALRGRLPS